MGPVILRPCRSWHPEPVEGRRRIALMHDAIQLAQPLRSMFRMPRKLYDWKAVQAYYDGGHGFVGCAERFGFSHTAWVKAIKRGTLKVATTPFADRRRKYNWAEVQAYYDAGHTYAECIARFGFGTDTWTSAVRRGELKARARALSIETMVNRRMARASIKRRLLELGLFREECSRCGIVEWRGKPINIHIDHVNGRNDDWRLENLRMLCPNCHSQTPTFSGRNVRRHRRLDRILS